MQGKYQSPFKFYLVRLQRGLLRVGLRCLLSSWTPMRDPKPGYTVIIGSTWRLAAMVGADLRMLAHQNREHLDRIIVVVDRPKDEQAASIERAMRERFPELPLHFIYYTPIQAKVLKAIGWGWAYAWLSWSLGIGQTKTRHALLQDFDALLLRPDVLKERYSAICERGDQYVGAAWYQGNGVTPEDQVVVTPELMFDCEFVRARFRPIDLFNHVTMQKGRTVDFDTFLYAQATKGRASVLPIDEEDMVHPSQMICQFTHLMSGRGTLAAERSNLLLVPYFLYLGGERRALDDQMAELARAEGGYVWFFGKSLHIGVLAQPHIEWLRKQAERLELAIIGSIRPEVCAYFDQIEAVVSRCPSAPAAAVGIRTAG